MAEINKDIILEIGVITYNHKNFIKKTLLSILDQETSYSYKIFILDDCSDDGSSEIINSIYLKNSDKIEYIRNKKNIGVLESAKKLSELFSAKYFCFLDGDDYWSYNKKIQTQIDFLENNPDYAGCFHDAKIEQQNSSENLNFLHRTQVYWKYYSQFNRYKSDFMPWDLVQRNIIPTASLIFRNYNISKFLENYSFSEFSLSWAIQLEIIKNSKFKYFNETWSVYNDHSDGISKKYDIIDFKLNNVKILESLLTDKDWKFFKSEILMSIISEIRLWLQSNSEQIKPEKEYNILLKKYKRYLKEFIKTDPERLSLYAKNIRNEIK